MSCPPPRAEPPAAGRSLGQAPWLLTFIDTVSLLLTFLVVLVAEGAVGGGAWQATVAAVRGAFDAPPAAGDPPTVVSAPSAPAPAPAYLAAVFAGTLEGAPLLAGRSAVVADGLRLTLPAGEVFAAGSNQPLPAAAADLAVLGRGLAAVANRLTVAAAPGPADDGGWASRDWPAALARARAVATILADQGIGGDRIATLASAALPIGSLVVTVGPARADGP
jgi:flagellar motor protein MotB